LAFVRNSFLRRKQCLELKSLAFLFASKGSHVKIEAVPDRREKAMGGFGNRGILGGVSLVVVGFGAFAMLGPGDEVEVAGQAIGVVERPLDELIDWEAFFEKMAEIAKEAGKCTQGPGSDMSCDEAEEVIDQVTDALIDSATDAALDELECVVPEWVSDFWTDEPGSDPSEGNYTRWTLSGPSDFGQRGGSWEDIFHNPGDLRVGCSLASLRFEGNETSGSTRFNWCCDLYLDGGINGDGSDFEVGAGIRGEFSVTGDAGSGFISFDANEDTQSVMVGLSFSL
jgi:hypothetical protein